MASCMGCLLGFMFIISPLLQRTTAEATITLQWSTFPASNISSPLSVGDTLVFNVTSGHSVAEFSKADYESCSNKNNSLVFLGPLEASFTFGTAGEHYYFCTIDDYCEKNMKLAINVVASPTSSPGSAPLRGFGGLSVLLLFTVITFLY